MHRSRIEMLSTIAILALLAFVAGCVATGTTVSPSTTESAPPQAPAVADEPVSDSPSAPTAEDVAPPQPKFKWITVYKKSGSGEYTSRPIEMPTDPNYTEGTPYYEDTSSNAFPEMKITWKTSGNNVIWRCNALGDHESLLMSEIDEARGTKSEYLSDIGEQMVLRVEGTGSWSMTVQAQKWVQ